MKSTTAVLITLLCLVTGLFSSASAQTSRGSVDAEPAINLITADDVNEILSGNQAIQGVGVVRVSEAAFQAGSGLITFSEFPIATVNPSYSPADYGGSVGDPTVNFDGFFSGQALGDAATCPPGAALTGCVVGNPTGPLSLDAGSPSTAIVQDGANPTSPVLSGSPTFNGPIAILFDVDVAGVGLDGGFFDSANSTAITAFARDGSLLGSVLNDETGIEFLGLVTANGSNSIAGLLFSLVGEEAAGFAIDNLRFGTAGNVVIPPPTGPAAPAISVTTLGFTGLGLMILALMLSGLFLLRRSA